jgi:hypothetical protein
MAISYLPKTAVAASLPRDVRPQIASSCAQPPDGNGWLHEPKHDGWRLIAILGMILRRAWTENLALTLLRPEASLSSGSSILQERMLNAWENKATAYRGHGNTICRGTLTKN